MLNEMDLRVANALREGFCLIYKSFTLSIGTFNYFLNLESSFFLGGFWCCVLKYDGSNLTVFNIKYIKS